MKIFGRNPIIERLRANPKSIRKIYVQQGAKDAGYIYKRAKQHNIPVLSVPATKLMKMARHKNVQGVMLDVDDYEYVTIDELLDQALDKKRCPVFLDGVQDPQNLGSILRTLACLGKFSVVLPTHDSVSVNETVLRVASGGENYVPVALVPNTNKAIKRAKDRGFSIAGSIVGEGQELMTCNLRHPIALVLGSEEKGIRDVIKKNLDILITIPMAIDTLSFNVGHAAAILCYEIKRQNTKIKS